MKFKIFIRKHSLWKSDFNNEVFNFSLAFLYLWSLEIKKLRNNAAPYQILLDESMAPTFSIYGDGTYRYVNKVFARGADKSNGRDQGPFRTSTNLLFV